MSYRLAILVSHPIQYFAPLYRYLARQTDIDVTVYYCHQQGITAYEDQGFGIAVKWDIPLLEGYKHKFLPNLRKGERVEGFFSLVNWSLIEALRQDRPDALWVNGHMYFTYLLGIVLANLLGIPVMMRCETHLLLQRSSAKKALRPHLMKFLYTRLCDCCLPIGSRNREFYQAHGVANERLFLVPYAVDNYYFRQAVATQKSQQASMKEALGFSPQCPVILYSSKLIPRKRPLDLIRAYNQIRQEGIQAALVIVGSGELEAELRRLVEEDQILDVHFCGFQNQSELPRYYALADIFVLPSENEPWGLVINEVMCAGLPVIASEEIGAVADLVRHGENGYRFTTGNIDELTRHLRTLVTNERSRTAMGNRSLEIIDRWDFEKCAQGVLAALQSLKSEVKK